MPNSSKTAINVREILANGDERCEVRWPRGADAIDSRVKDWRQVRDVKFEVDERTGESLLSFARTNGGKRRRGF
jgi:hypothetical protein